MKPNLLLFTIATLLLGGCANSLPKKIQSLNVARGTAKPTTIIAPERASEFTAFATRHSAFVENEVGNSTASSLAKFGRFDAMQGRSSDATVMFDSIRHGVTRVSNNLYAPIVEASVRIVGANGKVLTRRKQSATSGAIHTLEEFTTNTAIYREAIDIAADKLGMEIASGL